MSKRDFEIIDSMELDQATELEVMICKLPNGEIVVCFQDCTGNTPAIDRVCFRDAIEWVNEKMEFYNLWRGA